MVHPTGAYCGFHIMKVLGCEKQCKEYNTMTHPNLHLLTQSPICWPWGNHISHNKLKKDGKYHAVSYIMKGVIHLVKSRRQRGILSPLPRLTPQTFGFHTLMLNHWATENPMIDQAIARFICNTPSKLQGSIHLLFDLLFCLVHIFIEKL